jgi:hypothetical protein
MKSSCYNLIPLFLSILILVLVTPASAYDDIVIEENNVINVINDRSLGSIIGTSNKEVVDMSELQAAVDAALLNLPAPATVYLDSNKIYVGALVIRGENYADKVILTLACNVTLPSLPGEKCQMNGGNLVRTVTINGQGDVNLRAIITFNSIEIADGFAGNFFFSLVSGGNVFAYYSEMTFNDCIITRGSLDTERFPTYNYFEGGNVAILHESIQSMHLSSIQP